MLLKLEECQYWLQWCLQSFASLLRQEQELENNTDLGQKSLFQAWEKHDKNQELLPQEQANVHKMQTDCFFSL